MAGYRPLLTALAVLEKPGGFLQRKVGADSLVPGYMYELVPSRATRLYPLGVGWLRKRERERGFFVSKMAYFLARQPWPVMPCRLSGQQTASQTQARWVSRLYVDRLPVVD